MEHLESGEVLCLIMGMVEAGHPSGHCRIWMCFYKRELMVMVSFKKRRVNNFEVQNFKPSVLEVSTCFQPPLLQWSSRVSWEESAKP